MGKIDYMSPKTGRMLKEDSSVVNLVDDLHGTPATGSALPSGAKGIVGWLSAIKLALTNFGTTVFGISNRPFDVEIEITRPAAHDAYSIKDVINTDAATTLPHFDLSAFGINKKIIVNYLSVMSDQASVGTKLQCDARLYAVNNPIADCTDHGAFNPTYTATKNLKAGFVYSDADQPDVGSGAYIAARWKNEQRILTTDADGRIYLALLTVNAYDPAAGEKLFVRLTGFVQ